MNNINIEKLYFILNNHIKLVESYSEIKGIATIFKYCRLKPKNYIFNKRQKKLILYKEWIDEFGNSVIINNKKIKIILNDISLKNIICTDLYYGLSIDKIIKISKLVYMYVGKDEDLEQDCYFITLLGIDNYLRSYVYVYDEWKQVSPLMLGIDNLKMIDENKNINYFRELPINKISVPCAAASLWLSSLPASPSLLDRLGAQNKSLSKLFK